ncbi:putative 2-dehydropantoate 2-reductase [Pseudomonas sp. MAP12]|uniref:2-dehydropantoate 2-reductase n=1 Tax=Geopseudomonas aromaticivorans TaxID=2849492 RepID=A0ABS6MR24_9GAMM|nr:putative 2-dehydropantoate 2-reductase [Pseudomonas aromaticivorans]MBV2131253.1 putative 2-dehydropantoate 2-reductase [Pseudomonas aromaticivorans]
MSESARPRIGIIGTGAIGGYYGLMLARAGFEVHFLLRSEYAAVARDGLRVRHAQLGELHLPQVNAWREAAAMPPCDWLLVGAKTTSNRELAPLIAQVAAPGAKVVLLQNGLGVEDALRPLLPASLHLLGGLCFICAHREAPGLVVHQSQGVCNLGYHSGPATAEERQALLEQGVTWLREAGIESSVIADLIQARWQKLVWNVPYNGLSVLLHSSTRPLMANPDSRALLQALMQEVVDAALACGYSLPDNYAQKLLAYTDRMPDYLPSMYHDFAQRREAELPALYAAPLAAAAAAGVDMPRVRMLYQALAFLQATAQQ